MEWALSQDDAAERFYTHLWPHRAMVLRTARFLTRNPADAEDLAQETFMRAFRNIQQFDVASNARAWLAAILRHVQIDRSRLRGSALLSDAQLLEPAAITAAEMRAEQDPRDLDALLEQFSDEALIDALQSLPEDIRWTLLLVDVEQMTYDDAAEVVEVPVGTVKSRVFRGRSLLRDRLLKRSSPPASSPGRAGPHAGWRSS